MQLCIFGLGGVGSHLAYMLTKLPRDSPYHPANCELCLVDFDTVEEKNLARQLFVRGDVGQTKVLGIKSLIRDICECSVRMFNRKVESPVDVLNFSKDGLAIICTDNTASKRLIAAHFKQFILVNCDKDYYEIKTAIDAEENSAWEVSSGYNSDQTFFANVMAAAEVYRMLSRKELSLSEPRRVSL